MKRVAVPTGVLRSDAWRRLPLEIRGTFLHMVVLCGELERGPLIPMTADLIGERIAVPTETVVATIAALAAAPYKSLASTEDGVVVVHWEIYRIEPNKKLRRKGPVPTSPEISAALEALQNVPAYPFEFENDSRMIFRLLSDFPTIDVLAEIGKWGAYKLDRPFTDKSSPRAQLRTWFQFALQRTVKRQDSAEKRSMRRVDPAEYAKRVQEAKEKFGVD